MKNKKMKITSILMAFLLFLLTGCSLESSLEEKENQVNYQAIEVDKTETSSVVQGEAYYEKDDVVEYIHLYQELPNNYIRKSEANDMGWTPEDKEYVIGGDKFGNREGKLPKAQGRQYFEADVQAGYSNHRGPERIVYSDDGLIFYTKDHYESFEQLY